MKPKLGTILICAGLFVFFVILSFPYKNLRGAIFGQIYSATKVVITADDLYPSFLGWPGIVLTNATISLPAHMGDMEFSAKKITLRAGIGSLFPPAPSVSVSLSKLKGGGDLYVRIVPSRSAMTLRISTDAFDLKQLKVALFPEPIAGKISSDVDMSVDPADLSKTTGYAMIDGKEIKIPGQNLQGIILPSVPMGVLKAAINVRNGSAEIATFTFGEKGGDFQGSLAGDFRMSQVFTSSYLTLLLKVQLSEKYRTDPSSATLVAFLESFKSAAPGDYAMKWAASLQDMSTNVMSAIPQKAN